MKKTLFITICLCLLLSVVSCKQKPQQVPDKELYNDIISQYTELLTAKYNGEELPKLDTKGMDKRESEITKTLHGIVSACKDKKSAYNMGYGYKDMDGNGTPELFLMTKYTTIKAIFTISDGKPILLEANYEPGANFVFASKNRFFMVRHIVSDTSTTSTFYTFHVDGDKMIYDSVYGAVYDKEKKQTTEAFQIVDDKKVTIDNETLDILSAEYDSTLMPGGSKCKFFAPRIHFPLAHNETNKNLPVADFSSYSAILETYKTISTCVDDFDYTAWKHGEYDNLFSFPDDVAFDYYNLLLCGAFYDYYGVVNIGYDEIDLNGDGQDELVLMTENYNIKAIFTQKNGTPVMLAAFSYETCWIDDQGFIHVEGDDGIEMEYSLYEFTKNGDFNFVHSILLTGVKRFYVKNSKNTHISFEEWLVYLDEFCNYPEPFNPYEQTRNVCNITYTPLTKTTDDIIKTDVGKTWRKNADMEDTTGNKGSFSRTYMTFENVTDTQMDVNFKYELICYYPDPNKENTIYGEKTESFLKITTRTEDGIFVFDENGIKGKFEFGQKYIWIIIEKSTDERFPVGAYCYYVYNGKE